MTFKNKFKKKPVSFGEMKVVNSLFDGIILYFMNKRVF